MGYHKLLQKQIRKHFTEDFQKDPAFLDFISDINSSYLTFERDNNLLNNSFSICEKEYKTLCDNLKRESHLKNISLEKLKTALRNIENDNDSKFNLESDDLLVIVDYLNSEIDKRKDTQVSLNNTLKLLTAVLSNLNSGILFENENILYKNKLFCNIFSMTYNPEMIIGKNFSNSEFQIKNCFENIEKYEERISFILHNKVAVFGDELKLKDGRILERNYIPIYIENQYKGHLWDYKDITERIKFESQLVDLTNIQNAILNGNDYSIIYTDTSGIIKSFNKGAEKMLGYQAEEVIDIFTPSVFHDIDEVIFKAKELSENFGYDIKSGFDVFVAKSRNQSTETNEWTYIKKNGERINVLLSVSSIRNSENEIIGYLGISRDITEQKIAETELKLSEERYRNIVENSTDIIYKTNKIGHFTYVNTVAERITGYSHDELVCKQFIELIADRYKKEVLLFYFKQIKQKTSTTYYEFPIITKSGEEKWIGQSVHLTELSLLEFELTALAINITERKKYELKLIETNKRLELLNKFINNTSDAIHVSKEDGQMVYVNNEAAKRLGIESELVSNYNVKDFEKTYTIPEAWENYIKEVKQKGTILIEGQNYNKLTNKNFPAEVLIKFVEVDFVGYIIATSRDITERKIIEASIVIQKEKYHNIIANMNLGLLEVDNSDTIQFVNPGFEYLSGYEESELLGKKATKILFSGSYKKLFSEKKSLRKRGLSDMYEVPVRNKNGDLKWWMISGAPNYDDIGNMIGSIGIHLDITEQKKLEIDLEFAKSKAEESSKAKEAFLANMSHEIRTPLNAIIGMIRELSKEKLSKKQESYVRNTSIASQHLLSVLNNILDISKIEAGQLQLDLHHFELQKIFEDIKSILLIKCDEKELYLKINTLGKENVFLFGDSSRFMQILLNLIGNAVKFTSEGGIIVEYDVQDLNEGVQSLFISIQDTGIGMDETYLKNIFSKFSQEDVSTFRKYGGSGLGMSITKELIQLMNGSIEIKSEKNEGTTVLMKFIIPLGDSSKLLKEEIATNSKNIDCIEVLLVEDNEFNRLVAGNTLAHYNCNVTEAVNGLEAIKILKTGKKFDIILMDLQMPIMDGFECTKIIRDELNIDMPIIALTANAFKSKLEKCLNIGMNDCIVKPFEEDKLMNSIYKLIQNNSKVTIKKHTENIVIEKKMYNLIRLNDMSRDNSVYFRKMILIFIEQSTISISQINDAYLIKDFDSLYSVTHRIKPSIDIMGIEVLKKPIRYIEKHSMNHKETVQFKKQIELLTTTLSKVINQLKSEL